MNESFPELEEIINHLSSPEMVADRKRKEKIIMDIVWCHRFWDTING